MHVCIVASKECWQDDTGTWMSYGGFPAQIASIGRLFDNMTLVVVAGKPRAGAIPLPPAATIVPLKHPQSQGFGRKVAVVKQAAYYLSTIDRAIRSADVVHTLVPGDMGLLGTLIALYRRKHLLTFYNNSWLANSQTTTMDAVTRQVMRMSAGGHNVMLVVGDNATPPAPRMHWIFATSFSDVEISAIHPAIDKALSAPPRMIYAGRLSEEKGVTYLVKAIAHLKQAGFQPLPSVTVAGDGPDRANIEALIDRLDCRAHITLVGQLDRKELSLHMNQADLCVHPSLTEGFCKAWLDALMHGLPVLSSNVGAASGVIGQHGERGWLVPPGDEGALAEKIKQVLTTPHDWPTLRRRCRAYAEARTLEAWAGHIGQLCATQWNTAFVDGKLLV